MRKWNREIGASIAAADGGGWESPNRKLSPENFSGGGNSAGERGSSKTKCCDIKEWGLVRGSVGSKIYCGAL